MWRPGNRLLVVASFGLLAITTLHSVGLVSPPPTEGDLGRLVTDMRRHTVPMGFAMEPSVWALTRNPSLSMALLLVWVGVQNLLVVAVRPGDARLLRLLKIGGAGFGWVLTGLAAAYRIPSPLLSFGLVALLFTLSLAERSDRADPPAARTPAE